MHTFLLSFLLLLLHLPPALSVADFCDSEPRLSISTHLCPSNPPSPSLLFRLPLLDHNPFHALHDILWALSHYLHNCVSHHRPILHIQGQNVSAADCRASPHLKKAHWGVCVTLALAAHVDADVLFGSVEGRCFEKELVIRRPTQPGFGDLRKNFRALNWFGRGCVADQTGDCLPNTANSGLVPLPERYKVAALTSFRSAVMDFVDVTLEPEETSQRRVRVLLYDRNDTTRRQWTNAGPVYQKLEKDDRVDVMFVHRMPQNLRQQVDTYAWADVLVAPHGAAMVNTLFLRPGAEVVEIWKRCDMNIDYDRFAPHDWTGWHASLLDVNVQYVQCHRLNGPYKNPNQLLDGKLGPATDGPHKVKINEILQMLESSIRRQQLRLQVQREEVREERPVASDVRSMYTSFATDGRFTLASRANFYILIPACTTLLALWNLAKRRKCTAKR